MNDMTSEQDRLLDEAIDLMIRYQNDPGNPVTGDMIRHWRARGPQHEAVWNRISMLHGASGKILTEKRRVERMENMGFTRRNLMLGGLSLGAAGASAWTFGPGLVVQARADHRTAKGEVKRISLPDGSIATLGPDSALALDFVSTRRTVRLLAGMSFFDVARDEARPFSVMSDHFSATALGTGFDVSSDAGVFTVSVDHGLVRVNAASFLQEGEMLEQGQWISLDAASGRIERGQRERGQIASWRDKLIVAERESISALVARIGRWVPGRVVIADQSVGAKRVSGVFDLSDPVVALEAVVHPAGARVRRISSILTVISPI